MSLIIAQQPPSLASTVLSVQGQFKFKPTCVSRQPLIGHLACQRQLWLPLLRKQDPFTDKLGCSWSRFGAEPVCQPQIVAHFANHGTFRQVVLWPLQPQAVQHPAGMDSVPAVIHQMCISHKCQMHRREWSVIGPQTLAINHHSRPTQRS